MRILSSALIGITILTTSAFAQIVDVKLASDVWPPFTSNIENQALASQIVKEALNRNEVAMITKTVNFEQVIAGLKEDNYDGSAALWKNEERSNFLIYSKPYLTNQLVLVGRKGSHVGIRDISQLKGSKLALVDNYSYGISEAELEGVTVIKGKSDQVNLSALLKKEVDYIMVDQILIEYLMQHQPVQMSQSLEVASSPLIMRTLHFALRKNMDGADALIDDFNRTIAAMMADGTYNRILRLNWIKSDIDGDGVMELISYQGGALSPNGGYSMASQNGGEQDEGQKYYIAGTLYNSWDEIPAEYKENPVKKEDVEEFHFMQISF